MSRRLFRREDVKSSGLPTPPTQSTAGLPGATLRPLRETCGLSGGKVRRPCHNRAWERAGPRLCLVALSRMPAMCCGHHSRGRQAEPARQCVPRQSLGTRTIGIIATTVINGPRVARASLRSDKKSKSSKNKMVISPGRSTRGNRGY